VRISPSSCKGWSLETLVNLGVAACLAVLAPCGCFSSSSGGGTPVGPAFDASSSFDSASDAPTDTGNGEMDGGATADAAPDAAPVVCGDAGTACGNDLSNIGTGDFCISFTLTTTQMVATTIGTTAILNQRAVCNSSQEFWDIRAGLGAADAGMAASWLSIEIVDATGDDMGIGGSGTFFVVLNDGRPHAVAITRVSGAVTISVDGTMTHMGTSSTSFGPLPALAQGTDVCEGVDGTQPLNGQLTNVCITH